MLLGLFLWGGSYDGLWIFKLIAMIRSRLMERFRGRFEVAGVFVEDETVVSKQRQFWVRIYAVNYEE